MTRVVQYVRAMLERVPRLRRCGGSWPIAIGYAHALTRRQLGRDRTFRLQHRGLAFDARPEDWVTVQETCLLDEYGFLDDLFAGAAPRVVVDLGANIGLFALACFARWPDIRVFSVEASSATFALLASNRALHPRRNWEVDHRAIVDHNGTVSFTTGGYSTGCHVAAEDAGATETVPAAALTAYLASLDVPEIDLLKIDIEGAEEAALRDAADVLHCVRQVVIELHPDACDGDAVLEVLRAAYDGVQDLPRGAGGKPIVLARRTAADPDKEA